MNRKEITTALGKILEKERFSKTMSNYYAKEVTINMFTFLKDMRIDYLQFKPVNVQYPCELEKGKFAAYEIKSCYEDVYSGNGLNFIVEENYLVTTCKTNKKLCREGEQEKFRNFLGKYICEHSKIDKINKVQVLYACNIKDNNIELEDINYKDFDPKDWALFEGVTFRNFAINKGVRVRTTSELLFYMVRSNTDV